ncbi:hypothetical protein [Celeribacter sp.]|uniref:hypothetical protein n=1 Tax=Celeribacter sp. TaxID=1890673 RepID=UPI003A8EBEEF
MSNVSTSVATLCGLILGATGLAAQDASTRPVLSDAYVMDGLMMGIAEATERSKAAAAEQMTRYSQHDGPFESFVRNDPVLQRVSWPYGTCTDMLSLVPPPMEGWGLRSETLAVQSPNITDKFVEVSYVTFDASDDGQGDDLYASEQSVTITINADPAAAVTIGMGFTEPNMRAALLTDGPYGYPILPYGGHSTLLGPYLVDVTGTGIESSALYFDEMIRCAIDNGLIANGLDPATLTELPEHSPLQHSYTYNPKGTTP